MPVISCIIYADSINELVHQSKAVAIKGK